MGRNEARVIREAFNFNENTKKSECKSCNKTFCGSHITNLKRHLEKSHPEMLAVIMEGADEDNNGTPTKVRKIAIEMSEEIITKACLNIVTVEAKPFQFLDCPAIKSVFIPIFDGLKMQPITSRNIQDIMTMEVEKMTQVIKKLAQKNVISIKIDAASRHGRGLFCVNMQILKGGDLNVITLGVITLTHRSTGNHLKEEIRNVLRKYEIVFDQVYTITSDNGRNMISAVDLIEEEMYESELDELEVSDFEFNLRHTYSIRCAAHVLHLTILDFLRNSGTKSIIDRARDIVKTLRTPNFRFILEERNFRKPVMDNLTRWSTTYDMLSRLLEFKEFCAEQDERQLKNLTEEEWTQVQEITNILEPMKISAKRLQLEQLALGDFLKLWWELKLRFQSRVAESPLNRILFEAIVGRENMLLDNPVIQAAIFLDPRIRGLLPIEKEPAAKKHIEKLLGQIQKLKSSAENEEELTPAESGLQSSTSSTSEGSASLDIFDETESNYLRRYLENVDPERSSQMDQPSQENITLELSTYNPRRVDLNKNIFEYWEDEKYRFPHLYKAAKVVHAVPATQVTVERAFSAVRLILTDLRESLTGENLENIALLKLNKNLNAN